MNMLTLSSVVFGDKDAMNEFLLENQLQHVLFRDYIANQNLATDMPAYPLTDIDFDNFDDWLLMHQNEHEFFAAVLNLTNPFNMLDADMRKEDDFYEWMSQHYLVHSQIIDTLGIQV